VIATTNVGINQFESLSKFATGVFVPVEGAFFLGRGRFFGAWLIQPARVGREVPQLAPQNTLPGYFASTGVLRAKTIDRASGWT
jgi:hypothetical protein